MKLYTQEFRKNLSLAFPVILGLLGHTVVQLIDNIMVGQLGTAELASVSLGSSFVFIAMSLGIGFSTALTPLVAQAEAPFGGIKQTGYGREGGSMAIKDYLNVKYTHLGIKG